MADQIGTTRAFTSTSEYTDPNRRLCPQCGVYSVPKAVEPRIMVGGIFEESCQNCGHIYGRDALLGNRPIQLGNKVMGITVTGAGGANTITTDNGTLQMSAECVPADADNKNVIWSVDKPTIASISSTGLLTALINGSVVVKATAADGSDTVGELEVDISGQFKEVKTITVDGTGGASTITADKGTLQMVATVLPADAQTKTVKWSVENGTGSATINADTGLLTAVGNGTVTVKATATDGTGVFGSKPITISGQIVLATSVTVAGTGGATTITTDKGTLQMVATVLPANTTNKAVDWTVQNGTGAATISASGLLSATANGTVTVTATTKDGSNKSGNAQITISGQVVAVTGVTVDGTGGASAITADKGTLQMVATVAPANATNKTVTWSVDDPDYATINSTSGLLTAKANGSVLVTATSAADNTKKGTKTITISGQIVLVNTVGVQGASGATTITTDKGTLQMELTVAPADATDQTVTWSVDKPEVATVNQSGLVTAVADGTVVVTATANDASKTAGTATITVSNQT